MARAGFLHGTMFCRWRNLNGLDSEWMVVYGYEPVDSVTVWRLEGSGWSRRTTWQHTSRRSMGRSRPWSSRSWCTAPGRGRCGGGS